jgi:hypothetical protein
MADGGWVIGVEVQASPSDINKGIDWIGAYAPSRNDDALDAIGSGAVV